jgi:tetratricopeptide (TPR) repeat protein
VRLAASLRAFWGIHGHVTEGRRWLDAALGRSPVGPHAPTVVRAEALRGAGTMARHQGDFKAARAYLEESVRIARDAGSALQVAWSTFNLGTLALCQGDLRAGRTYFEESLAVGREAKHDQLLGNSLNSLGEVARLEGEWAAARALYEQALAVCRQKGIPEGLIVALVNVGAVACEEGDLPAASACYREALAIAQELGSKEFISCCLDGLGRQRASGARGNGQDGWRAQPRHCEEIGYEHYPADRAFRERYLREVREALGEAGLEAALAEGQALTLEQAIDDALET